MKKLILLLITTILLTVTVQAQPELEITESKFYFGHMPQHSTVTHYFWLKSTGSDTLVIKNIKTGCICAVMPFESNQIAPGDSMKVGFFWDIKNSIYKTGNYPSIYTNAKQKPYHLNLTGIAVKSLDSLVPLSCSPYKFELARFNEKSIDEIEFKLTNMTDKEIELFEMSFPVEECVIEYPHKIPAFSSMKGSIKVKPEFLDKEFKSSITIAIAHLNKKRITIPIRRKIF